ncbi:hypothetical protein EVAR_59672_1 [Eumeta japonica]|uniref:Uncharacterized protein n=1 Tax=Eumeta variegata TaxID=151549 RepID=A0A4C1Z3K6_EUMVA|nr:hypothetical protein EVAR_59672_1 [Eumeta japonica]
MRGPCKSEAPGDCPVRHPLRPPLGGCTVRWSAARSGGRIAMRGPLYISGSVLPTFTPTSLQAARFVQASSRLPMPRFAHEGSVRRTDGISVTVRPRLTKNSKPSGYRHGRITLQGGRTTKKNPYICRSDTGSRPKEEPQRREEAVPSPKRMKSGTNQRRCVPSFLQRASLIRSARLSPDEQTQKIQFPTDDVAAVHRDWLPSPASWVEYRRDVIITVIV